ncbi:alpha/beta hydrolase family protein [Kitasatospora sp. CB01950]|uniref:alpha/beta hydrolase family protein n=1 Tax=Kitasatospora sp. CB01950 TaxID=1703930 RepID=UPI00093F251A|nr:acetylhydrolase [Kitasatospora sp. CB01950]OKJ13860.1 acetylhydrolase [Kitasatospora sp. CB01950]
MTGMTRRRLLGTALALGAAAPLATALPARADTGVPERLTLPAPTGPFPVGTVALHLVDPNRPNPIAGMNPHRELMASVWYPARAAHGLPLAPWLPDGTMRAFLTDTGFPLDPALVPLTAGRIGAPVHRTGHGLPVVVYSHGSGSHRADHTVMVQELASHGYVVVTVDHLGNCFSELPDGRVITPADRQGPMYALDYSVDLRFVLDCVEQLAAGRNPDAERRPLPDGLGAALDTSRIGMFGWSKGGTATACTMLADRRVRAGLALDGPMQPGFGHPSITADLDRPFMMMTAGFPRATDPYVAEFWSHLRGWRLEVRAAGAVHVSYGDNMTLIPQAGRLLGLPDEQIRRMVGTIDPSRALLIQQAYPLAFFDLHLRHRAAPLLSGPSPRFPEVAYLP